MKRIVKLLILSVAALAVIAPSLPAAEPAAADLVQVTVTAVGRRNAAPPEVTQQDVLVYQDNDRRPVVDWQPVNATVKTAGLDLAILVEDSLDSRVGTQLNDLKEFIRGLPADTRVAVAYARNGAAPFVQEFTTDHERVARALRLPAGSIHAFSSPFQSLADLMKRWPESDNRREVLLISSGIDLFYGISSSTPGQNPSLDRAINLAQKNGVVVFGLYASTEGRLYRNRYLITNGQGSLLRLAYETGGEAYFQGSETPVAFKPFLERLTRTLGQQYLLTFRAQRDAKSGYDRLRVTTEVPGVELVAPERVFIPKT